MQRFEYKTTSDYEPPNPDYDRVFSKEVTEGWRLVSVVKRGKEDFVLYWEKPFDG